MIQAPQVYELVDGTAREFTFHIVCRVGAPAPKTVAMSHLLARMLPDGTADVRRDALRSLSTRLSCSVSEGLIVVTFGVSADDYKLGIRLTESLLSNWSPNEERVKELTSLLPFERLDPWQEVVLPYRADYNGLNSQSLIGFWNSLTKSIAVSGPLGLNSPRRDLAKLPSPKVRRDDSDPPKAIEKRLSPITTLEWRSAPTQVNGHTLLAVIAFGAGQQSSVFRCWRQEMGLTYRQDAVLSPAGASWHLRLVAYRKGSTDVLAKEGLDRVKADVENWNQATLETAREILRSYEQNGFETRTIEVAGRHLTDLNGPNMALLTALGVESFSEKQPPTLNELRDVARALLADMKLVQIPGS
ncbi:MAG TPA: hypothetical protein PKA27_15445 [Fimbriimonadaceae bacterium]|nr:hypothetical protein [Fimbriimonadaceae bacterium]